MMKYHSLKECCIKSEFYVADQLLQYMLLQKTKILPQYCKHIICKILDWLWSVVVITLKNVVTTSQSFVHVIKVSLLLFLPLKNTTP